MNPINSISRYIPSLRIDTPTNVLNKATMVAIPTILLVGSLMNGVAADAFSDCMEACDRNGRDAGGLAKLLCYAMCWAITG